jgi:uncharacterized protein YjbJ (UPF0337 family)
MARMRIFPLLLAAGAGATAALLLDPQAGARRRALVRDKLRHYGRVLPASARRGGRMVAGPARGALHRVARRVPWRETTPPPDQDQFIKQRVESELGHETDLPLGALNFDAADGVVRVRGTVPDEETARRIVRRTAAVEGVRAVVSLMRTPDGTVVGGMAGDTRLVTGRPRAAIQGEAVARRLKERWPGLTDADILATEGHTDRLVDLICTRTGEPAERVRPAVDAILLAEV